MTRKFSPETVYATTNYHAYTFIFPIILTIGSFSASLRITRREDAPVSSDKAVFQKN